VFPLFAAAADLRIGRRLLRFTGRVTGIKINLEERNS